LTPDTPASIARTMKSSAHRADAKLSLTPGCPSQETLLVSSSRSGVAWARAIAALHASIALCPARVTGVSSSAIVGVYPQLLTG
jgi:hypothetical protein